MQYEKDTHPLLAAHTSNNMKLKNIMSEIMKIKTENKKEIENERVREKEWNHVHSF